MEQMRADILVELSQGPSDLADLIGASEKALSALWLLMLQGVVSDRKTPAGRLYRIDTPLCDHFGVR